MKFFLKTKMFSQTYSCRYTVIINLHEHPFSNNKYLFIVVKYLKFFIYLRFKYDFMMIRFKDIVMISEGAKKTKDTGAPRSPHRKETGAPRSPHRKESGAPRSPLSPVRSHPGQPHTAPTLILAY